MMRCYVIAEAGVNHNGSEELAFKLIDAAVDAGADAVKFQTFKAEKLVSESAEKAAYQERQTGKGSQLSMLKALELSDSVHKRLAGYCAEKGIEFLSTPFDEESAEFLINLGCKRIKIPSGELTNIPFIRYLAGKGLPLILSTGMAELYEVEEAVKEIIATRAKMGLSAPLNESLTLLHCTSNYPADLSDVNLLAMNTMADFFDVPVGYSDHTQGIFVAPVARAAGASLIEKHFTLDRNMSGPDHAASLEPEELRLMIENIRLTESVLGRAEKKPVQSELETRTAARRSVVLLSSKEAGSILMKGDLVLKRPGNGIQPADMEKLIGRKLKSALAAGTSLSWSDIEEL